MPVNFIFGASVQVIFPRKRIGFAELRLDISVLDESARQVSVWGQAVVKLTQPQGKNGKPSLAPNYSTAVGNPVVRACSLGAEVEGDA